MQSMAKISTILLILTLVFLHISLVSANTVNPGATLSTNGTNTWNSPSGEFALGFRQLNGTTTSLFMVAIWYEKIPDKTIVWNAETDNNNLAVAPTGSQLHLKSEGLTLTNPQGQSLWTAKPNAVVSQGAMLDTGNFVLLNANSDSVWESFENPTGTLLPNQTLEKSLTCRFTETNYTNGRFQLHFRDGNVFLSPLAWPTQLRYDNYHVIDASGNASHLVFNESGDIYVETMNGTRIKPQGPKWENLTLNTKEFYYRATLDFYGVFTQYRHPRDPNAKQDWEMMRYFPDDICNAINNELGSGSCWYNSYCSMENHRPICRCPSGYSFVDPHNEFGGCQPNFTLVCGSNAWPQGLYTFDVWRNVNFPFGDYEKLEPYSKEECQQTCLEDCMCAVSILGGKICWKKRLPLTNGRVVKDNPEHFAFIKISSIGPQGNYVPGASNELPTGRETEKDDQAQPVLLGSLIGSLVVNSILLTTVVLVILLKPKRIVQAASLLETNLHSFTYEVIKEATQDFSEELGRGSFGIVYKGNLESESCDAVAVKRLDRLGQEREKEFKTELSSIGKTYHKNLVRLIGYCDEGVHRILVYELMANGNLADILFGQHKPIWNLRVGFALGIARGLVYLHEECDTPIIHCDIKPQNVLIDENFTAKISDFGLAKLLLSNQSRTNTMVRGTKGYVAPEWFKNVPVTVKVDVYSFGVILLEIICCRRNVLLTESGEEEKGILTDWAYDCYTERRIDALVEDDNDAMVDNERLQKWVKTAIWCIQEHHEMRPTMGMVFQMLEGFVEVPDPPPPYSFS